MEPAQLADLSTPPDTDGAAAQIRLSVPAHGAFLSMIRTTTAAVGARLDLTIDEIEDLRIAVDEAAALLLPDVDTDGRVDVTFSYDVDDLRITLASRTGATHPPSRDGFGWTVLAALAGAVDAAVDDGVTTITLVHHRASAE